MSKPRYIQPFVGSAPVGTPPIASGHASVVIPTPVSTVPAVVTAGDSSDSTTSGVVSSTVSSAAPPQATKTRARTVKRMIPCLRNGFIIPPFVISTNNFRLLGFNQLSRKMARL